MRTRLEIVAAIVVVAGWFVLSMKLQASERARHSAERVRDSLAIEAVAQEAMADGWEVRFGELDRDLRDRLAGRDSVTLRLAKSLDRANAQVRSLVDIVATLEDSLASVGAPEIDADGSVVAWAGNVEDGLLTGSWRFAPPELALRYSVAVPLEIVTSEGGDGRWLVTARATDPRASAQVEGFWFAPPPPVQIARCTLPQVARWLGIGVVAGYGIAR